MESSQILIVEDDQQLARLLSWMLAPSGYHITICGDLLDVLAALRSTVLVLAALSKSQFQAVYSARHDGGLLPCAAMR